MISYYWSVSLPPWGDQKTNGIVRPVTMKELEKPVTELANDIGKTKEPFYFTFDYFQMHLPNGQRCFQHHFLYWAPESFLQQFQPNVWVCLTTPNEKHLNFFFSQKFVSISKIRNKQKQRQNQRQLY